MKIKKNITAPPPPGAVQAFFHCFMWNTDWTAAHMQEHLIANYSSRLDKAKQCCASKVLIVVIKIRSNPDIQESYFRCASVITDVETNSICALNALIAITLYFCMNTSELMYCECFYNGRWQMKHVWRSCWRSVMFVWAQDAPNTDMIACNRGTVHWLMTTRI